MKKGCLFDEEFTSFLKEVQNRNIEKMFERSSRGTWVMENTKNLLVAVLDTDMSCCPMSLT